MVRVFLGIGRGMGNGGRWCREFLTEGAGCEMMVSCPISPIRRSRRPAPYHRPGDRTRNWRKRGLGLFMPGDANQKADQNRTGKLGPSSE